MVYIANNYNLNCNPYFSPCSYGQYYGYGNGFGSVHDGWTYNCCNCGPVTTPTGIIDYYRRC